MSRTVLLWLVLVLAVGASARALASRPRRRSLPPATSRSCSCRRRWRRLCIASASTRRKTGRLVRRLHEDAEDGAFIAGLNGLITSWDRKDDAGNTAPAGRYAARGWAVGEMRVEGVNILGNDWTAEDEGLRITSVETLRDVPDDDGLVVLAARPDGHGELLRLSGKDGTVLWRRTVPYFDAHFSLSDKHEVECLREEESFAYALADGQETRHSIGEINSIGNLPDQFL